MSSHSRVVVSEYLESRLEVSSDGHSSKKRDEVSRLSLRILSDLS